MKIWELTLALVICGGLVVNPLAAEEESGQGAESMLRAAIFVQNRAGSAFRDKVDVLNDFITARLTERGFSILDKQYVLDKFRESRHQDQETKKLVDTLQDEGPDYNIEEAIKGAAALRLAQMISARFMLVATISSMGHINRSFKGYGVENEVTDYTLRVSLRLLEAAEGGSIYSDVVQAVVRVPRTASLEVDSSDIINTLLYDGAEQIAGNIAGRMEDIRKTRVDALELVNFDVAVSGVDYATIELNGVVIGSAGPVPVDFTYPPGIHMMRVTRDWFTPWERPISIQPGSRIRIELQLSEEGIARYQSIEGFKQQMEAIAAEAYARRQLADGERKRLEESFERIDTSRVERLSIGDQTPRVIVEKED